MKRGIYVAGITLPCLVGGFLLLWPYEDDRSLSWPRRHLEVIDGQLQGLKELLRDYNQRHGHYPANDEGLAALDNFESRFTLTYHHEPDESRSHNFSGFLGDGWNGFWWERSKSALRSFRDTHGKAPQNQKEFCEIGLGPVEYRSDDSAKLQTTQVDIAIDSHDNLFLLDKSGVLSPWLLPYIYENRTGHDAKAFQGSLADGDRWGYAAKVDDGVTISSSGGYLYARELNRLWWQRNGPRGFGVSLIVFGAVVAIFAARGKLVRPLTGLLAVIPGFLVGGFFSTVNYATCYISSGLFSHRSPEMVALQLELLEKYRQNGVINDETYRRAAAAAHGESVERSKSTEKQPQ